MSKIDSRNTRLLQYTQNVESAETYSDQIRDKVEDIADNKNLTIDYNNDTVLDVLDTIDNGTIKTPSGTKNITDTALTDVTNYANAQVVDSNLTSANIITGKTILGVSGSAVVPSGTLPITSNGVFDVTNYENADVNVIPSLETITDTITQNNTYSYTPTSGYDGISRLDLTVNVSGGGGYQVNSIDNGDGTQTLEITDTTPEEKTVIFYDYDGTVVEEYTKAEFLALNALPANPTHTGLVAQGWNWSLADAKTYVTDYGDYSILNIGQMYRTSSGLTEFDIVLNKASGLTITFAMLGNVNWGDGTSETVSASTTHTYSNYGTYTITCDGTEIPSYIFGQSSSAFNYYCTMVRIGEDVTTMNSYGFAYMRGLINIIIPTNITQFSNNYIFYRCSNLTSVIIPNTKTLLSGNLFQLCSNLKVVSIPNSVTTIAGNAFEGCAKLTNVTIPSNLEELRSRAFYGCINLTKIVLPNTIQHLSGLIFTGCRGIKSIFCDTDASTTQNIFNSSGVSGSLKVIFGNNITTIGNYIFAAGSGIGTGTCPPIKEINIPNNVTTIGENAFRACETLINISIPSSVTNINSFAFYSCVGLTSVTIPSSVTSIGNSAFRDCYSITLYDFTSAISIPILGTSVFQNINTLCKIVVPDSLYSQWITETNWVTYADYIYKASEVN